MRSLNLSHKAFLLILVPLFFEVLFLSASNMFMAQLDKAYQLENKTRNVLQLVNLQTKMFPDAAAALGLAVANRDISQMNRLHRTMAKLKADRNVLMSKGELNDGSLRQFNISVDNVIACIEEAETVARQADQFGFMRSLEKMQAVVKECNEEGDRVSSIQIQRAQEQRAEQGRLRGVIQLLSNGAVAFSILISILMVLAFNRGIANRLKIISKNAIAFANDKPIAPALKGSDEIVQLDHIFHDMASHLKDLRRREKALTDNASEIICSIGTYFEFTSVNKAVTPILGYSPDELLDKSLASICQEETIKVRNKFKEIAEKGTAKPFLLTLKTKKGDLREIMWSAVYDQSEKSFFCVAHDVTEINETARLKRELTAMATHDLRAPLASLQLTLDLFCKNTYGQLTERGMHRATQSRATIGRLVTLINSFLEIDKLESGNIELHLQEEIVADLIQQASAAVQSKAEEKGLSFEMEGCSVPVVCDGPRLTDVFQNFLDNAIKYSPQGGAVKVVAHKQDDMLRISVRDQGPGVPADKTSLIFEKFKQGNVDAATEKKGTGLGLAICKAIIEAHGGTIGCISDGGGHFWFTLPVKTSRL